MIPAFAALSATALASGCELLLGDFPPAKKPGDAGADASGGGGASTSAASSGGGGATSSSAGGASSSSSGTGGACCDCDGDKHDAVGTCGGDDCDDDDPLVFKDEPTYYGTASKNQGFDYDCSGAPERDPALDKTVDCGPVGLPCAAATGFLGTVAPACGATGNWGTCKQQGLGCVEDVIEMNKLMKCK